MKLTVSTDSAIDESILYLLELDIDGKRVYKIGITSRKIEDRVCEILTSHFGIYRYFPYCRPKRFRKIKNTYEVEQYLLEYFKEYQFTPECKFSGSTELIHEVELALVVQVYEEVVEHGEYKEESYDTCEVCKKLKRFTDKDTNIKTCGSRCTTDA